MAVKKTKKTKKPFVLKRFGSRLSKVPKRQHIFNQPTIVRSKRGGRALVTKRTYYTMRNKPISGRLLGEGKENERKIQADIVFIKFSECSLNVKCWALAFFKDV